VLNKIKVVFLLAANAAGFGPYSEEGLLLEDGLGFLLLEDGSFLLLE